MKPSLEDAYARVRRAENHLTVLQQEIDAYWRLSSSPHLAKPDSPEDLIILFPRRGGPIPSIWGILAGEIIYNLRASLDYLVYELAYLDSGNPQDGTQFPIEDTVEGFNGRSRTYLKWLSVEHRDKIGQLQPYLGCDWTYTLRLISNPDKHRHLTAVQTSSSSEIIYPSTSIERLHGGRVRVTSSSGQHNTAEEVQFDDGSPVVETLEDLSNEVVQVLRSFRQGFQT